MKKIKEPKIGDKIYVYTSDFMTGGVARISNILHKEVPRKDCIFVTLLEDGGAAYNYDYLLSQQETLKKIFGRRKAKSVKMERLEEQVRQYGGKVIW